jgi:lysophospholipase L1-like esterase
MAVIARRHTDDEVAQWTTYLQTLFGTQGHVDFLWSGDSLTLGEPSSLGGFRKRVMTLWQARNETDRWYRNVGPYNVYQQFDQDWCQAVGGRTIAQMTADLPNFLGPSKPCKPHIIPLMLGTNDITTGNASRQAHYDTLLDTYASLAPQAKIIVQRPLKRSDGFSAASETFGDLIRDVIVPAAQSRGVNCIYDDTAWTASQTASYINAIHPDAAGYDHIGTALEPQTRVWAGIS